MFSASSAVTYTFVYTDSEPGRVFWGADEELSDVGPKHPPSPDYVPDPEHPPSPVEPLPVDASPTALSPGYVADSDPDEDLEEDPEEDHAAYPVVWWDGDYEPSDDDDDDDDTDDEDEEPFEDEDGDEEEEHLTLADSFAIPIIDLVPLAGDTEAFETNEATPTPVPSPKRHTARMSVRPQTPIQLPSEAEIPSPPLPPPLSSLHLTPHVPTSLPLPLSSLPPLPALLFIPPPVDHREDIPEAELPPHKRLCSTAPTLRYEVGESSTAAPRPTGGHRADYRFISTMDVEIRRQRAEEVDYGIRDVWEQDTQVVYTVIEDAQDRQTQLSQRVDVLVEDRQFHYETARLLDQEALVSRESWAYSVGLSSAHRIESLGEIRALQARDQARADAPEGTGVGLVFSFLVSDNHNNMPPRRSSATIKAAAAARAAAAATARAAATVAAAPMTVVAVE
ncbi:hypothetical protein Tco_0964781 [Tanacetum coccineum]